MHGFRQGWDVPQRWNTLRYIRFGDDGGRADTDAGADGSGGAPRVSGTPALDDSATLAISVGPPPTHKIWSLESGFTFPVLSDFWPHGEVSQAYGVFNDDAGYSNRGTFVVDRSGIIRFAEMQGAGEARDQRLWTEALAALKA